MSVAGGFRGPAPLLPVATKKWNIGKHGERNDRKNTKSPSSVRKVTYTM